jgi:type VI secretion system protein ImpK
MHPQINDLVYPVLSYGLVLKERLARGETLEIATEQGRLIGLLQSDTEARRFPDYGGDGPFLGIRYALVCWLDEIFVLGTPWGPRWNEQKLETALYSSNARAERFWQQAKLARSRPGGDALEAFFLCVMLGFRGAAREDLAGLRSWVDEAKAQLGKNVGGEWAPPAQGSLPTEIRPLRGHERLRRMLFTGGAVFLVMLCIAAIFFVIRTLSS